MDIPEVALRWVILHSTSSNVDLARLTNVCPIWRDIILKLLLDRETLQAMAPPILVLPSMTKNLLLDLVDSSPEGNLTKHNSDDETFCAAWFDPCGIQVLNVRAEDDEPPITFQRNYNSPASSQLQQSSEPFAPSGGPSYEGSEDEMAKQRRRQTELCVRRQQRRRSKSPPTAALRAPRLQSSAPSSLEGQISCTNEWRGYRDAVDVLTPFGYDKSFIQKVIATAKEMRMEWLASSSSSTISSSDVMKANDTFANGEKNDYCQTTFAVRGATVARPEGYCLCWESQNVSRGIERMPDACEWEMGILEEEHQRSIIRRKEFARELKRTMLPRVVHRHGEQQQQDITSPCSNKRQQRLISHPCVQFLNSDRSHAVRLMTPPFPCGPIPEPISIIMVAIATEDGCFCSGLNQRFEFGHMYPNNITASLTELSSVCIATNPTPMSPFDSATDSTNSQLRVSDMNQFSLNRFGNNHVGHQASRVSDDSSCDSAHAGWSCNCPFKDTQSPKDHEDETEEDEPEIIHRGQRVPGLWHCYTAIFDGPNSVIRVDGQEENLESSGIDNADENGNHRDPALLDGLVMGSDHCFDMSLCFGQGSGGEGEGAISELVVFKGRLDQCDIEMLEKKIMNKHNIPTPAQPKRTIDQDDKYTQAAHALFGHHLNPRVVETRVPLRFMARNRAVAWHQNNAVTGERLKIKKIGTRLGASSSDW